MSALKPPGESDYFAYDFTSLLGANTIASITSVRNTPENGRSGNLTGGTAQIVGNQVRVLWGGGDAGTTYLTTVAIKDSGNNPLQLSGEIYIGLSFPSQPCQPDPCCPPSPCNAPQTWPAPTGTNGTTVYLYGGVLKREIIKRAYGICGQSTAEFELEPEEYVKGLQALNDQMGVIGPATGYNFPTYGDGSSDDESGILPADMLGVSAYVAELLGPQIGKTPVLTRGHQRAMSIYLTKFQCVPTMQLRRTTPRGSGSRWRCALGEYFNGNSC